MTKWPFIKQTRNKEKKHHLILYGRESSKLPSRRKQGTKIQTGKTRIWYPVLKILMHPFNPKTGSWQDFFHANRIISHQWNWLEKCQTTKINFVCSIPKSGFQLSVVKPKPKELLQPITKNTDNTVNQSKLEVITGSWCKRGKMHANTSRLVQFGCTSDWMKKWRDFLSQSCSVESAKPIIFRHSNENRL